jgi:hypothetical protein
LILPNFKPCCPKIISTDDARRIDLRFFEAWKKSAAESRPLRVWGVRQWFVAAAHRLAERGYRIETRARWLRRGWLVWKLYDPISNTCT